MVKIVEGESFRVDLGGWDAHALRWKPKEPDEAGRVLLLHGGAAHAHTWAHLAGVLSDRFDVVALDQRGHGISGPSELQGSRVLADDVGRLLDALGWAQAALVGHSMGGQAAYLYAAAHPERVQRLVVIDSGPEAAPEGIQRIRQNVEGPASFADFDEALAAGRRWFPRAEEDLLRYRVEHNLEHGPDGRLVWRSSSLLRGDPASRRDHTDDERWAAWKALAIPTLLIHGADSDILTDRLVARFVEVNSAVVVARIADAGHSIPIEQPEALARVINDFLTGDLADGSALEPPIE